MKIGTFLEKLAKKAGVDTTTEEFINLLSFDIDVPDKIANKIDVSLMDKEAAKANPEIIRDIKTKALNGVDAKIDELLAAHGLEDGDEVKGVKEEKNSYEKIVKLTAAIKNAEANKAKPDASNKDIAKYEEQIRKLNEELKTTKQSLTTKETEFASTRESDLTNFAIDKKLLGKNYDLPTDMDSDLKVSTAFSAVKKELAKKGFKIVRDSETGSLKVITKEGQQAYSDTNEILEADAFIDGALAQNKLLKVNDPSKGNNPPSTVILPDSSKSSNPRAVAEIDAQLKAMG